MTGHSDEAVTGNGRSTGSSAASGLVGRDAALADLAATLAAPGVRLVTLTGPGGVGKTRLAVAAADLAHRSDRFEDVIVVELAAVGEPGQVAPAVARALALRPAGPAGEAVEAALANREVLLVLDNLEHVISVAPWLGRVLGQAPGSVILATSRERLRLAGEREVVVSPLGLPGRDVAVTADVASGSPAVELFVRRVRDLVPGFAVTAENAPAVAEICRRLDGLPLAIELAAPWVASIPPDALLPRLETRVPLLMGGARDAPARQRTLGDTIAWSYDLLGPAERWLFMALGVFSGGFTLDALDRVVAGVAAPIAPDDVAPTLAALVAKSLVQRPEAGRYALLETVHAFALGRLERTGTEIPIRASHVGWVTGLSVAGGLALDGPDLAAALATLDAEVGNVRAAVAWLESRDEPAAVARIVAPLYRYWTLRSLVPDAERWLRAALERRERLPAPVLASALRSLATVIDGWAEVETVAALYAEAVAIWRDLGDRAAEAETMIDHGAALLDAGDLQAAAQMFQASLEMAEDIRHPTAKRRAMGSLGNAAFYRGEIERARDLWEAATAVRGAGNAYYLTMLRGNLAVVSYHLGQHDRAIRLNQSVLAFWESLGGKKGMADALGNLGGAYVASGDPGAGLSHYERALSLAREIGDRRGQATTLYNLADLDQRAGRHLQALAGLRESLALFDHLGFPIAIPDVLEAMADHVATLGRPTDATALFASAAAWRARLDAWGTPDTQARREALPADLRNRLGAEAFAAAWVAGEARAEILTVREALTLADDMVWSATRPAPPAMPREAVPGETGDPARPGGRAMSAGDPVGTVATADSGAGWPGAADPTGGSVIQNTPALSRRELQVLRLVAEGEKDRDIGAALFISHRTVSTHVTHIFDKLGVDSRASAVARALRAGLL